MADGTAHMLSEELRLAVYRYGDEPFFVARLTPEEWESESERGAGHLEHLGDAPLPPWLNRGKIERFVASVWRFSGAEWTEPHREPFEAFKRLISLVGAVLDEDYFARAGIIPKTALEKGLALLVWPMTRGVPVPDDAPELLAAEDRRIPIDPASVVTMHPFYHLKGLWEGLGLPDMPVPEGLAPASNAADGDEWLPYNDDSFKYYFDSENLNVLKGKLNRLADTSPNIRRAATDEDRRKFRKPRLTRVYNRRLVSLLLQGRDQE